jgi:hypothetical protein
MLARGVVRRQSHDERCGAADPSPRARRLVNPPRRAIRPRPRHRADRALFRRRATRFARHRPRGGSARPARSTGLARKCSRRQIWRSTSRCASARDRPANRRTAGSVTRRAGSAATRRSSSMEVSPRRTSARPASQRGRSRWRARRPRCSRSRAGGDAPLELGRCDEDLGDGAPATIAGLAALSAPCPGASDAQSAHEALRDHALSPPWRSDSSRPRCRRARDALAASLVWSVEKTRWPVSEAWIAISAVSRSRISPTRMTSGSCA